jgi:redox-sensitive bicupin YhaK (pirin superfamily)
VIKVIAGTVNGVSGAVRDVVSSPEYLDVSVPAGATFSHPTKRGHTVFAYVFEGAGHFDERSDSNAMAGDRHLVSFDDGDAVTVRAGPSGVRFLLVSGKPLGEPIAWRGPIVMNTDAELRTAFEELQDGTFIKTKPR